jgi:hypothetical protein
MSLLSIYLHLLVNNGGNYLVLPADPVRLDCRPKDIRVAY